MSTLDNLIAAQSTQPPERIPNTEPGTQYPRWMRPTKVFPESYAAAQSALTVDTHAIVHAVRAYQPPGIDGNYLGYVQRRWEARIKTGFSPIFNVSTSGTVSSNADIAHDPQDNIYVVWTEGNKPVLGSATLNDVFFRKMTANGWGNIITVAKATFDETGINTAIGKNYTEPRVVADASGNAHVIFIEEIITYEKVKISSDPDVFIWVPSIQTRAILYCLNPPVPFETVVLTVQGSNSVDLNSYRDNAVLQVDTDKVPQVAWRYVLPTGSEVRHRKRLGVSGQNNQWVGDINTIVQHPKIPAFDFALGPTDDEHYVYEVEVGNQDSNIRYRIKSVLGILGDEEGVSTTTNSTIHHKPRIVVDSRNQPHAMWEIKASIGNQAAYAARVKNPTIPASDPWFGRQETVPETLKEGIADLAIFPGNDVVHLLHGRLGQYYSRQYEPNLGDQDAFGTFAWGRNSSTNVGTGNHAFSLAVFGSRGVGFATNLSLIYNSLDFDPENISLGWKTNYGITLTDHRTGINNENDYLTLKFGDGRYVVFRYRLDLGYHTADDEYGYFSQINRNGVIPGAGSFPYVMTTKFGIKYGFDDKGRLAVIADTQQQPNTINFSYGSVPGSTLTDNQLGVGEEVLTKITDSVGRETLLEYNAANQLVTITDPAQKTYSLAYDGKEKLYSVKFDAAPGIAWKFEHFVQNKPQAGEKANLLARVFTPRGTLENFFWQFYYHADNRVFGMREPAVVHVSEAGVKETAAAERVAVYDETAPFGNAKAKVVNRRGSETALEFEYFRALVLKVTDALGHSLTRTFLPDHRNLKEIKDKRGFVTKYTYHNAAIPLHVKDNLATVIRPKDAASFLPPVEYSYTQDGFNRMASVKDALGAVTESFYTAEGNLEKVKSPAVATVTATGPGAGAPTVSTQSLQAEESFVYDPQGRMTESKSANGGITQFFYGDSTLDPTGTGLTTSVLQAAHTKQARSAYDKMGNTVDNFLPEGGKTHLVLDGLYRTELQVEPSGGTTDPTTQFFYTPDSQVKETKNPRGFSTKNEYDRLGRLIVSTNAKQETTKYFHDREGNTRIAEDPKNVASKTEYDELNRAKRQVSPGPPDMISAMEYDPNGNLVKTTEMPGAGQRVTEHRYDARNNPAATIHPDPALVDANCFDANDNRGLSQRRIGPTVSALGELSGGTFQYGTQSLYDARNRLSKSIALTSDPGTACAAGATVSGLITKYGYDAGGNRRTVTDPKGNFDAYVVDAADRQTETIDAKGVRVSRVIYDDNDRRVETRVVPPDGVPPGADGFILSRKFDYNDRNELKTETDIQNHTVTHFYDANSNRVKTLDEKLIPREFVLDKLDRVEEEHVQIKPGVIAKTTYHYNEQGDRDKITDPRGQVYLFEHDNAGRQTKMIYPPVVTGSQTGSAHAESRTYNEQGELLSRTDALGRVAAFEYDALGRLKMEVHKLGNATLAEITREYDGASNLLAVIDAVTNRAVEYKTPTGAPGYDHLNRMTQVQWKTNGALFKGLKYEFDDDPAMPWTQTTHGPDGEKTVYIHDANHRLETVHRNNDLIAKNHYDPAGRRHKTELGNGAYTQWTYDEKEQAKSVQTLKANGALLAGYAYHHNERGDRDLMVVEHLGITADYQYNDHSWLTKETYTGNIANIPAPERSYTYDEAGNRKIADRSGQVREYKYDEENRLYLESSGGSGGALTGVPVVSSTKPGYDPAVLTDGDTTDSTKPSGCWRNNQSAPGPIFAGLDFGTPKEISSLRFYIPTKGGIPFLGCLLSGMRRFKIQVGDGTNFTDVQVNVNTLVGARPSPPSTAASPEWLCTVRPTEHEVIVSFAPVTGKVVRILMRKGSLLQPKVMRLNEISAFAPATGGAAIYYYFYDDNGNLVRRLEGTKEETFEYDYRNLLVRYLRKDLASGAVESDFSYWFMPTGQRLAKINNLTGAATSFMCDGEDVVSDYPGLPGAAAQSPLVSYANALAIDSKIARIQPGGSKLFYTPDALGSATQLTDDGQAVVNKYLTTAWGEDLIDERPVEDRYGFTQRERDEESGLMYYRARWYDARVGRFVGVDPILEGKAQEPYRYARNNPMKYIDSEGRQEKDPEKIVMQLEKDVTQLNKDLVEYNKAGYHWVMRLLLEKKPKVYYKYRVAKHFLELKCHAYQWFGADEFLAHVVTGLKAIALMKV